jgi:hypothetical protein
MYQWFHNNVPTYGPSGAPIVLFIIPTQSVTVFPTMNVVQLGLFICKMISESKDNNAKTYVDRDNFFWLSEGALWSDILSVDHPLH